MLLGSLGINSRGVVYKNGICFYSQNRSSEIQITSNLHFSLQGFFKVYITRGVRILRALQ